MNTIAVSRVIRRAMIPLALLLGFLLWWNFGTLTVPPGMDTLPDDYPPGTLCVIDKRPGIPSTGQVVFFDLGGGMLISRIARVEDQHFFVDHDDESRFADGDALGPIPIDAIRALVLSAFATDEPSEEGRVEAVRGGR